MNPLNSILDIADIVNETPHMVHESVRISTDGKLVIETTIDEVSLFLIIEQLNPESGYTFKILLIDEENENIGILSLNPPVKCQLVKFFHTRN